MTIKLPLGCLLSAASALSSISSGKEPDSKFIVNSVDSDQQSDRPPKWDMDDGFTLMELLIVISIILILMLMAVPSIGSMMKRANETSAINSLRTIVTAEFMYANSYPRKGFACSLGALSGDPASGPSTPDHAQLIESDIASGNKSGYNFTIKDCIKANNGASDYVKGYTITAVPEAVGKTGNRGFCVDQNGGSPKYDSSGGTNCVQILQ